MNNLLIPNTTQVPNFIIDVAMPLLSGSAFKVLMVVVRKTYGFRKDFDKLSLTDFQKLTGLSRSAVNEAIKDIGPLLNVTPAPKNTFGLDAVNEYALNLEFSGNWGEWYENHTTVKKTLKKCTSSKIKLVQKSYSPKPIREEDIKTRSPIGAAASDNINSSQTNSGHSKKATDSASPRVPGVKQAIDTYHDLFVAKFGAKPDIVGGRDGTIVSGLVKAHGADEVLEQLRYFFDDPPDWIKKGSKFTIPAFKSAYNEILAKRLNGKSQMKAFYGG